MAGDSSVEVDSGGTLGGGGLSGDDDARLDRREMKSEPGDAMADVYSESSEMSTDPQSHSGEGMDPRRPVMYSVGQSQCWQITHSFTSHVATSSAFTVVCGEFAWPDTLFQSITRGKELIGELS